MTKLSGFTFIWNAIYRLAVPKQPRKIKTHFSNPSLFIATGLAVFCCLVFQPALAQQQSIETTRVIPHSMGETKITGTPQRIVTLFQGATDTAVALGVIPVGVVESWVNKPVYPYLRDALKNADIVGLETQPNLERLVALKPDLIIASKFRHETLYQQLSAIAPVIFLEEIFDFKQTLELVGLALNQEQAADDLLVDWNRRTEHFRQVLSSRDNMDWPIEVSLLNFRADHLRLLSRNSFSGLILSELGFEHSSFADTNGWIYKKLTSKEALPTVNADTFFVFLRSENPAVDENYDNWRNHPLWKTLKASRSGQIYKVDEIVWSLSGGIIGANMILDDLFRIYDVPPLTE